MIDRRFLLIVAAALVGGCAQLQPAKSPEAIMDSIERQVRLPDRAEPLGFYAKLYAYDDKGKVRAVYFRSLAGYRGPVRRGCTSEGLSEKAGWKAAFCPPPVGMAPGARRWLASADQLPDAADGGCNWIHVSYDLVTGAVEGAGCNGYV